MPPNVLVSDHDSPGLQRAVERQGWRICRAQRADLCRMATRQEHQFRAARMPTMPPTISCDKGALDLVGRTLRKLRSARCNRSQLASDRNSGPTSLAAAQASTASAAGRFEAKRSKYANSKWQNSSEDRGTLHLLSSCRCVSRAGITLHCGMLASRQTQMQTSCFAHRQRAHICVA